MSRLRRSVMVSGEMAGSSYQGGAAWAVLQYAVGLERLGVPVHLVEPVQADQLDVNHLAWMRSAAHSAGFGGTIALVDPEGRTVGQSRHELLRTADRCRALLNLSGTLRDPEVLERVPVSAYVDLDPGFNQFWHESDVDMGFDAHTHHVTVGLTLGGSEVVPRFGLNWIPTLPPVVLSAWPALPPVPGAPLTTVANWRSYGSIIREGVHYGQKAHSFRRIIELPERVDAPLQVALDIHPDEADDIDALRRHGWQIVDPATVAGDVESYRRFIQGSAGEIGIAKAGYADAKVGWFSDRSACYLASARPVVAQDTGVGDRIPTGLGLFWFSTIDEAVEAVEMIVVDPQRHASAARRLAEDLLDSDLVLGTLLQRLGVGL